MENNIKIILIVILICCLISVCIPSFSFAYLYLYTNKTNTDSNKKTNTDSNTDNTTTQPSSSSIQTTTQPSSSIPPTQYTTRIIFTGNNYFNISQIVIYDMNNNTVRPTSINAPPKYAPDTLDPMGLFDGTMSTRAFPNNYVSSTYNNVVIEIVIPSTLIKSIKIYNRADCCIDRIGSFTLKLQNNNNEFIYSKQCEPVDVQTITITY